MSTGSLGGHGLADRQYCFHLRSSVTGHARFYKIIVVFSMSWYTDRKRTGNLKERKNYHADTRITTAANLITAATASLEHPVPGRCRPGRDAEKEEIDNPCSTWTRSMARSSGPSACRRRIRRATCRSGLPRIKRRRTCTCFWRVSLDNATKAERGVFRHMVEFLEPGTGLLPETVEEVAEILAAPLYVVERCLSWLHQMEPAGVGAATTSESLVLQAFHKG